MSEENSGATCVSLRLRRTTYEDAYVNVPVTDAILKQKENGTYGIDYDAFVAEAIRLSENPSVEWRVEEHCTEPHPVQKPRPEDRQAYDVHSEREGT